MKGRRAQTTNDHETWVEGGPAPTLNLFDNAGETRATVLVQEGGYNPAVVGASLVAFLEAWR